MPLVSQFRLHRIVPAACLLAVLAMAAIVLPGWIPLLPRPVQRGLTEAFLRAAQLFYLALWLAAAVGIPVSAWLLARSWRRSVRRTWREQLFLLCLSCLGSLVTLELGSAVLLSWIHRFPRLPTTFPPEDPALYRILVLGESSALGEPFRPWLSVGQIVASKLEDVLPGRRIEVEMLAFLGDSLEQQHLKLAGIKRRPDAVIIYSGHNEFAARFEENRDYSLAEEPGSRLLRDAQRLSLHSPFCRLVHELVSKNRLDRPPLLDGRHQLVDPPLCSPAEESEILADFAARLEAIVSYCDRIGALPILISPPANEADYEPGRSTVGPGVSILEREQLARVFAEARRVETTEPGTSERIYRAILDRHPSFAEAHYRLGHLLLRDLKLDEARIHFSEALENDGLPIRCKRPFREAYAEVAARHRGCLLIDGRAELMAAIPDGLLDDHVIEDTHHPNLKGYAALAGAVLRELRKTVLLRGARDIRLPLDPAECCARMGLDAKELAIACERTSVHLSRVSGYRYDPSERLEKSRKFAAAARKLRTGTSPRDLGLPGLDFRLADRSRATQAESPH
jgi:lysophospholipase L1-like esterase